MITMQSREFGVACIVVGQDKYDVLTLAIHVGETS